MSERSYSDIVARLENRAETLAQTALNGRDNRLIKLLETAAQEIKTLRASLQPATPTAGEMRTFDTTGTKLTRVGSVLTITCESGEIANRVVDQLRTATGGDAVAGDAKALREIVGWVDSWVSNPVGSYSVAALEGLFRLTRDRIAALRSDVAGDVQAARASEPAGTVTVEDIVRLAMSDGEYIGRHLKHLTPAAVIELRDGATAVWLKSVRAIMRDLAQRGREPGFVKPDTERQVFFYEQDFYVLSNFSAFNLRWAGLTFPTSEHAYHWEKFNSLPQNLEWIARDIHLATSAHEAFKTAEKHKKYRRSDWDAAKVPAMRLILRAKAAQHEYVRRKLLETGDRELIEDSWRDDFWGWGPNRDGQNMLGKLWMEVRAELRGSPISSTDGDRK